MIWRSPNCHHRWALRLRYRILPGNASWRLTWNFESELPRLNPGDSHFGLRARAGRAAWHSAMRSMPLPIPRVSSALLGLLVLPALGSGYPALGPCPTPYQAVEVLFPQAQSMSPLQRYRLLRGRRAALA